VDLVSVIIVNWNGKALLAECLDSLRRQSYRHFEVILVDNCSNDGSVEFAAREFPEVVILRLKQNRGFAGGNIEGLRHATGKYVALVNTDVVLDQQWLEQMVAGIELNEKIGICASKIIKTSNGLLDSAGDFFTTAFTVARPEENSAPSLSDRVRYVPGACAAAAMYRRKMLDGIGFFDADFFLNHEDTDLNLRALVTGWKCLYVPQAVACHKVSASIGILSDRAVFYTARNSLWVWIKNVPDDVLWKLLLHRVVYECAAAAAFCLLHRKWKPYLKGKLASLQGLPRTLRKRKKIQSQVIVSGKDIRANLIPVCGYLKSRLRIARSA
jgi:GT2 family glycosyltransferase